MAASLEKLIVAIKKLKSQNINEAQTKDWLIRPFFEYLGWDFSSPEEVVPEDDDSTGKRTDYCFYINETPKLLVEAKALSNSLVDNKMIIEKLNYCANRNIPLLITNQWLKATAFSHWAFSRREATPVQFKKFFLPFQLCCSAFA